MVCWPPVPPVPGHGHLYPYITHCSSRGHHCQGISLTPSLPFLLFLPGVTLLPSHLHSYILHYCLPSSAATPTSHPIKAFLSADDAIIIRCSSDDVNVSGISRPHYLSPAASSSLPPSQDVLQQPGLLPLPYPGY